MNLIGRRRISIRKSRTLTGFRNVIAYYKLAVKFAKEQAVKHVKEEAMIQGMGKPTEAKGNLAAN